MASVSTPLLLPLSGRICSCLIEDSSVQTTNQPARIMSLAADLPVAASTAYGSYGGGYGHSGHGGGYGGGCGCKDDDNGLSLGMLALAGLLFFAISQAIAGIATAATATAGKRKRRGSREDSQEDSWKVMNLVITAGRKTS